MQGNLYLLATYVSYKTRHITYIVSLKSYHNSMDMSLSKLQKIMKDKEVWSATVLGSQRVEHDLVTDRNNKREVRKSKLHR